VESPQICRTELPTICRRRMSLTKSDMTEVRLTPGPSQIDAGVFAPASQISPSGVLRSRKARGPWLARPRGPIVALAAIVLLYLSWQLLHWIPGNRESVGDLLILPIDATAVGAAWCASRRCSGAPRLRSFWRLMARFTSVICATSSTPQRRTVPRSRRFAASATATGAPPRWRHACAPLRFSFARGGSDVSARSGWT
jgi:hypothetical protein